MQEKEEEEVDKCPPFTTMVFHSLPNYERFYKIILKIALMSIKGDSLGAFFTKTKYF